MQEIDFHCHLDDDAFTENNLRADIVRQCFEQGFSRLVTVADPFNETSVERTREILGCHERVSAMIGAHPHEADKYGPEVERRIFSFTEHPGVIAIGEAGLDFHYNLSAPDSQQRVFARQIAIARELGMALLIHSRKAEKTVLGILEAEKFDLPVIFHCYTGNREDAREIIRRGYNLSFSGIITFKKAEDLREVVSETPLHRIFSETDSPYLAPEPFRGKTNNPLLVKQVIEKIAEIRGIAVNEVNTAVNRNFDLIFKSFTEKES